MLAAELHEQSGPPGAVHADQHYMNAVKNATTSGLISAQLADVTSIPAHANDGWAPPKWKYVPSSQNRALESSSDVLMRTSIQARYWPVTKQDSRQLDFASLLTTGSSAIKPLDDEEGLQTDELDQDLTIQPCYQA